MKISLLNLEEALKNPRAFIRAQKRPKTGFRYSRYLALRGVAVAYHAQNDLGISETMLEARLAQKFKGTKGNDECLEQLREYVAEFTALGTTVAKVRNRVKVVLPEEYKDYAITGEVARLDLHPAGGYRALLFSNRTDAWADEIRFPVLQDRTGQCHEPSYTWPRSGVSVDEISSVAMSRSNSKDRVGISKFDRLLGRLSML